MSTLNTPRRLDSQTLVFDEIDWTSEPLFAAEGGGAGGMGETPVGSSPAPGTGPAPTSRAWIGPYWQFSWRRTNATGLLLTNVVVRNTQSAGSTEPVAETIDFTDLKVRFSDTPAGGWETFDIAAAMSHAQSRFEMRHSGSRRTVTPNDDLYQTGLYLKLVHDFGGTCRVTLVIAVVFRGAANDFDPGGVPWSLNVYPQIGWKWEPLGDSGRRVEAFRGSVRVLVNNKLFPYPYLTHPAPDENIANLLTDSNTSMNNGNRALLFGLRATLGQPAGKPFGWAMVFDYTKLNMTRSQEMDAVWGPTDGAKFSTVRSRGYFWPQHSSSSLRYRGFFVSKLGRQAMYDNIHLHAKMPHPDTEGNLQIHAPFCGHSCVHMHWRWSNVSSNGALGGRGWAYKGWSTGASPEAFKIEGAPLIPPNQKLKIAICAPSHTRASDNEIIAGGSGLSLDVLRKLIWYHTDIISTPAFPITANQQQVIMEHGLGWAYRYSTPQESNSVDGLTDAISDSLPWTGVPTQQQLMGFFENDVYPTFRYFHSTLGGYTVNQVPEGTFDDVEWGARIALELL